MLVLRQILGSHRSLWVKRYIPGVRPGGEPGGTNSWPALNSADPLSLYPHTPAGPPPGHVCWGAGRRVPEGGSGGKGVEGGIGHLQLLGYSASSRPLPRCPEYKAASVQDIRAYNPGWGGTFRDQPQPARGLASPSPPRISTSDPYLGINHPSEFVHSTELGGRADVGTVGAEISGHAAPGPPTQRAPLSAIPLTLVLT